VKAVMWPACFIFAATLAFGQRSGGLGPGPGGPRAAPAIPAVRPIPPVAPPSSRFPGRPGPGRFVSPYGYPLLPGDYGSPMNYEPPPVFASPAPVFIVPPPPPPRSEIREYRESGEPQPDAAAAEPKFAIALKDGSVRYAVATFVQGDMLAYVDPDGRQQRVPGEDVDRDATRRLNQALKLNLYLPPPTH